MPPTGRDVSRSPLTGENSPVLLGVPPAPKDDTPDKGPGPLPSAGLLGLGPVAPPTALAPRAAEPKDTDPRLEAESEAKRQVLAVLDRYALAHTRKQIQDVVAAHPTMTVQARRRLQSSFLTMVDFEMKIVPQGDPKFVGLDRDGATATIVCKRISRSRSEKNKEISTDSVVITVDLERKNGVWTIQSIVVLE